MPVNEAMVADGHEIVEWRQALHRRPELLYDVEETAGFVAEKLRSFGLDEVVERIGRTGVVGLLKGSGGEGPTIGLRADMDALPIAEETGLPHASEVKGLMHACGHDGHTAMLLGAARELARTRAFAGQVAFIFQPAEEGGAGGLAMIRDGLFSRFPIRRVYGMHNLPGLPVGHFGMRPGPIMASTDGFEIVLRGRGGHAALPHRTVDPVVVAAALVQGLQTVVARNTDPLSSLVLSVTEMRSGFAHNVIPDTATLSGTVRALSDPMRDFAEERVRALARGIAEAHGAEASVRWSRNYPVTVNDAAEAEFCAGVARDLVGEDRVDPRAAPLLAGEDFSYMLQEIAGSYVFVGNGDSAELHSSRYDFCDAAIPFGTSYWVRLAETALPLER